MAGANKKKLIGAVLFAAALLLAFGAWLVFNNAISHLTKTVTIYSDTDRRFQALKDHGWIPEAVPANFTNMRVTYGIDNNDTYIQFELAGSVDDITSSSCVRTTSKDEAVERATPFWTVSGWPSRMIKKGITSSDWPLYDCKFSDSQHFWLTASSKQRVYLWRKSNLD